MTADSAVDRLDGKIAQMEILLSKLIRRSNITAQQIKQLQLQQLQSEQQQQQQAVWFQTQRQQLEEIFYCVNKTKNPTCCQCDADSDHPRAFVQPVESPSEMKPQHDPPKPKKLPKYRKCQQPSTIRQPRINVQLSLKWRSRGSRKQLLRKNGHRKREVMLLLKLKKFCPLKDSDACRYVAGMVKYIPTC